MREAHRRGRRRIGGSAIAVPAPQIAARRHQPLAGLQIRLQHRAPIGKNHAGHRQTPRQRVRAGDEIGEGLGAFGQRRALRAVEGAQIAPMMRRGFVERSLQIVAQRGRKRCFVAGLHRDGIDQRRPQALSFGAQQLAQRLGLGNKALHFSFGFFERQARLLFGLLGLDQPGPRIGSGHRGGLSQAAGVFGGGFGGAHVGRNRRAFHCGGEAGFGIAKLLAAGVGQFGGDHARTFQARLAGIAFGEF